MVKLTQLLEKIKTTPVDLAYVRKKLPPRCKAMEYISLKGKHRSELFKDTDAIVCLIPKKGSDVGHFVVLLAKRHHIEYFSSLGGTPESELQALKEPLEIMKAVLGKNYITNTKRLQSGAYSINDCAVWCLLRCFLKEMKLREFQGLFARSITLQGPDDLAAMLGVLLFVELF